MCPAGIGSQNHEFKEIALSLLQKGEKGLDELFLKINGDLPIPEIVMNYQRLIAVSFHPRQENVPIFSDEELKRLTMPSILFVGDKAGRLFFKFNHILNGSALFSVVDNL